ncbi:MAG: hypothetical protein WDN08_21580 [Rhizomicrobium sp.]
MNTISTAAAPASLAQDRSVSARDVVVASYKFAFGHAKGILAAIGIPVGLAAVVLLILFKTYFSMLAFYLRSPDSRLASLTMSATVAGVLIWLLLNAIASTRLARYIGGETLRGWFDFQGMARGARLYAALLRYLLVNVVVAAMCVTLVSLALQYLPPRDALYASWLAQASFAAFAILFWVRCGLLLPAVAVNERRLVLRRAWELSRGQFWKLAAVGIMVAVLPAVLPEAAGELLIWQFGPSAGQATAGALAAAAAWLATDPLALATIVLSLSVSTALTVVLTTIGSHLAYRRLAGLL